MPTIAFIMQTYYGDHIGGAERQVQMLGQALREAGWKTAYLCERSRDKPRKEIVERMEIFSLPERKKRWTWRNYDKLKWTMNASRANLFYTRVRHPYTGLTALAARTLGKPMVWAAASQADVIRKLDLRQTAYAAGPVDRLLHPLNRKIEDWGICHTNAIILQTEEQQRLLQENYHRQGEVIPNHIHINPSERHEKQQPPVVLWLSNIKPFKRPEIFLNLAQTLQDLPTQFVMAGGCPDLKILAQIQDAQKRLPNFHYLGALPPQLAEQYIAAATLLINTSLFEGFPNAFQQAWYHGVPTLSLGVDPDGIMEREKIGKCASSLESLEQNLRQLLNNPGEVEAMGLRAKACAVRHYDLKQILPKYLTLFERLLNS